MYARKFSFILPWKFKGLTGASCLISFSRGLFFGRHNASTQGYGGSHSIEGIAKQIKDGKRKNIIVMAGAGISTPSGIPDFRSPGTGLYDNVQKYHVRNPTDIFDIFFFRENPQPFFTIAKELWPGNYRPNPLHYFARLLHDKGILLRLYTQNIDGLERLAGLPPKKLVEAHGTFTSATCTVCRTKYTGKEIEKDILNSAIPMCHVHGCNGIIKPDIVFFGEQLPDTFYMYLADFPQADLLIVMGTSLEVEPFASIAESVTRGTPRLLLNRRVVGTFRFEMANDVVMEGDLLTQLDRLVTLIGWKEELHQLMEKCESSSADEP